MQKEMLGRVLGPTCNVGNTMSQWILKANGKIVPQQTGCPLLPGKLSESNVVEKEKQDQFTSQIKQQYGDSMPLPLNQQSLNPTTFHMKMMR